MGEMLELIKNQIGSTGQKGWPVVVRDRISYPSARESIITDANAAVTFLWTMRDAVIPYLEKQNLAIAANFYTPAGLAGMIRNILANPYIRYIILLGEEYSSKSKEDQISDKTSANALRSFFEKGINAERKITGFESAVYFDRHIPTELIEKLRKEVQLIDLNKKMPSAAFEEKIKEANRLIKTLQKKGPFLEQPHTFAFEGASESFPYEGGPVIVHDSTIPKTWIDVIHNIHRYGKKNLMNANTDRWVKEINNMIAVIHDPQNTDLSINPFLVPLTKEKIDAYQREIKSPILPPGKAYTYGNKLRAYIHSSAKEIIELVNTKEYKDFEFGKGKHLDANINYKGELCEIDQIKDIIDVLKRDPYSKAGVAITWHVSDELMRKHKSSPCLVLLHPIIQDEKLNLMVYFRSHDMTQGWPENAYGCAAIQKEIADAVGIETGILTIISGSAQIYAHYYQQVEEMLKRYKDLDLSFKAPRGNYLVEIKDNKIIVSLVHPETGKTLEIFEGTSCQELRRKIAKFAAFEDSYHPLYLGSELMRAEYALKNDLPYEQDVGLD